MLSKPASAWNPGSVLGRSLLDAVRRGERCRIVFVGDSLTSTEWVHPNWRDAVEYALKQCAMTAVADWRLSSWGLRCFNAGFDGATTRDWLARIDEDVLALDPDLAIVLGTRNDWEFAIPAAASTRNMEQLLIRLQTTPVPHIVYATSFADANRERLKRSHEYFASILAVATRLGVTTLDLLTAMSGSDYECLYTFEIDDDNAVTGSAAATGIPAIRMRSETARWRRSSCASYSISLSTPRPTSPKRMPGSSTRDSCDPPRSDAAA